jgi:hypothetical protein
MGSKGSTLHTNAALNGDDYLLSDNGSYAAYMQDDGNFVLCRATGGDVHLDQPYWSAAANMPGNYNGPRQGGRYVAIMQGDGNFVLYNGVAGNTGPPYWATNTVQPAYDHQDPYRVNIPDNYHAVIHDDGNFTVDAVHGPRPRTLCQTNTAWAAQRLVNGSQVLAYGQWINGPYWATGTHGYGAPVHVTLTWNELLWGDGGASPWPDSVP